MTENTMQVPRPNEPQKDRSRLKFGLACGLAVAGIVGAFTWAALSRSCKPGPEKIITKTRVVQKDDCPKAEKKPVKGDDVCELDKGEHDPLSPNWDPKSCGYCGDDIQQSWESKETCPVDFLCEKGNESYWRKTFGTYKDLGDGKLVLTTIKITKKCKKGDAVSSHRRRRRRNGSGMKPDDMEPVMRPRPVVSSGGVCPKQPSAQFTAVKRSIRRNLGSSTSTIWSKYPALRSQNAKAYVTLRISSSGTVTGVSVSVAGKPFSAGSVGLSGLVGRSIGYSPGSSCTLTVGKTLPRGDR